MGDPQGMTSFHDTNYAGQGKATASACEALARNPGARGGLMIFLILGLALIESLTLFTLVIILLKVKV